jgi:N,N-dimethylformamidase
MAKFEYRGKPRSELIGYATPMVVHHGDTVSFMVSTEAKEYDATIVRLIHGDNNPEGPGFKSETVSGFKKRIKGRHQDTYPGSFICIRSAINVNISDGFTIQAWIRATNPKQGHYQGILAQNSDRSGFGLYVDPNGGIALRLVDENKVSEVTTNHPIQEGQWYFVICTYDPFSGNAMVMQRQVGRWPNADADCEIFGNIPKANFRPTNVPITIAAGGLQTKSEVAPINCFNGKIENPRVFSRPLASEEIKYLYSDGSPKKLPGLIGAWDFSKSPANSTEIIDISENNLVGTVVNFPMRGLTGHNWTGRFFSREEAPHQYASIHFHDDDLEDTRWDADFDWNVPSDLKSGIYAAHLLSDHEEDFVPFIISDKTAKAKTAFLVPTMTYLAYANERAIMFPGIDFTVITNVPIVVDPYDRLLGEHTELGGSIYDVHSDGSGICYSTSRRPIVNMRPNHRHWVHGCPRKLPFDLYLVDWLEQKNFEYDVITDHDLHHQGKDLLEPYDVIMTGSHPEYWTSSMLDGLDGYLDHGGRLMYLGGNGFYWVTAVDPERDHILEVRRGYAGSRAWPSHVGELELASTGEIGGIWRHLGRPPNALVGVGFAAQGWDLDAPGYKRLPASFDSKVDFIFSGIGRDEMIGDFGLVMSGAAGDELDRVDFELGTPAQTIRLATSQGMHSAYYLMTHEDQLITLPDNDGTNNDNVRADMVYFETQKGGAVFSVGSINWLGSLSHNGYENNVSTITENVLREFTN